MSAAAASLSGFSFATRTIRCTPRSYGSSPSERDAFGIHRGSLYKVLALQLELCLPRLVSSPAPEGSIDGLRAFSRNPGRRASPASLLLSERLPSEARRVVPVASLMAKIRKWLGLGKKS
jgi:hypothetical protein